MIWGDKMCPSSNLEFREVDLENDKKLTHPLFSLYFFRIRDNLDKSSKTYAKN